MGPVQYSLTVRATERDSRGRQDDDTTTESGSDGTGYIYTSFRRHGKSSKRHIKTRCLPACTVRLRHPTCGADVCGVLSTHLMFTSSRDPGRMKRSVMRQKASYCDGPSRPAGSEKSPLSYLPPCDSFDATTQKRADTFFQQSDDFCPCVYGESKVTLPLAIAWIVCVRETLGKKRGCPWAVHGVMPYSHVRAGKPLNPYWTEHAQPTSCRLGGQAGST